MLTDLQPRARPGSIEHWRFCDLMLSAPCDCWVVLRSRPSIGRTSKCRGNGQAIEPWGFLYLKNVPFARDHLVQHGIDEEADKEPRNQTGHNDDGERLLRVGANSGRERRRKQSKACNQSGHHDGTKPQE